MKIINKKSGNSIMTLDDWFNECPPRGGKKQWVEGYSAYEIAREYIDNGCNSLCELFKPEDKFVVDTIFPEYTTKIDSYGQGRVHDLLVLGKRKSERILISVEGKVNESFGNDTISSYYMKSRIKLLKGQNTNMCERIDEMLTNIFDVNIPSEICNIKYQLITSLYGTLKQAHELRIKRAYLVVQVFISEQYNIVKGRRNHNELNNFIRILDTRNNVSIKEDEILGPYKFKNFKDIEVYIGYKITP